MNFNVCGWPEANLKREYHSDSGFSDYILSVHGKPLVTVEAKNEGETFVLPSGDKMKSLKLNGAILTDATIKKAIVQVRGYCDDLGIRYAIATNGYSWIIFRAIKEDGSWKEGNARVFPSVQGIVDEFVYFDNSQFIVVNIRLIFDNFQLIVVNFRLIMCLYS